MEHCQGGGVHAGFEGGDGDAGTTFEGHAVSGAGDEELAEDAGGDAEEVMAVFPVDFLFLEAEVEIVDEGGGGGGFVGFALEVEIGEGVEFAVDAGDESFEGEGVTRRPAVE